MDTSSTHRTKRILAVLLICFKFQLNREIIFILYRANGGGVEQRSEMGPGNSMGFDLDANRIYLDKTGHRVAIAIRDFRGNIPFSWI